MLSLLFQQSPLYFILTRKSRSFISRELFLVPVARGFCRRSAEARLEPDVLEGGQEVRERCSGDETEDRRTRG